MTDSFPMNAFSRVRVRACTMLLLAVAFAGCSSTRTARTANRTISGATQASDGRCTPGKGGARVGQIALSFIGASSGEANVRIEGEAYKSTVLVDVSTGTVLELAEGTYQLRITLSGYRAVDRSVTAVCGRDSSAPIQLNRR